MYKDINIDWAEIDNWDVSEYSVPFQIYNRLVRNEPSAKKKTQTAYIVLPIECNLDDLRPINIEKILTSFENKQDILENPIDNDTINTNDDIDNDNGVRDQIYKISSSSIFEVDKQPAIRNIEKLQYIYETVDKTYSRHKTKENIEIRSAEVQYKQCTTELYIYVSWDKDFADSSDIRFFTRTFPTLFPFGKEDLRQTEKSILDTTQNRTSSFEIDATIQGLVSS